MNVKTNHSIIFLIVKDRQMLYGFFFLHTLAPSHKLTISPLFLSSFLCQQLILYVEVNLIHIQSIEIIGYTNRADMGAGLKCHRMIKTLCQVIGIKDMYARVEGSTNNYQAIARGFLRLLKQQVCKIEFK
ncbi:unnamed protein product [Schistosoma margrebowiei]|uniref:Uncharacterized protein n=1 Tax=Schistosoma margrebowiei TaxID=48269 RepID=A0A183MCI7_9TREM|nr:unnamed protein product [Schistosoma margrebowiei]